MPGFGPCTGSGWPDVVIVCRSVFDDAAHRGEGGIHVGMDSGGGSDNADVGAFILRHLQQQQKKDASLKMHMG